MDSTCLLVIHILWTNMHLPRQTIFINLRKVLYVVDARGDYYGLITLHHAKGQVVH